MRTVLLFVLLLLISTTASACELVGDIFQAGFWAGTIVVVLVLLGVGFLVSRLKR